MTCGYYLAELVERFLEENTRHTDVYTLLLETLRILDTDAVEVQRQRANASILTGQERHRPNLLMRYFELHLLSAIGYEPALHNCAHCGSEIQPGENGFKASLGGVLCPQCSQLWDRRLSLNALKVLRFLQRSTWAEVERLRLDISLHMEIESILHSLLRFHLERDLKSWSFLEMLSFKK